MPVLPDASAFLEFSRLLLLVIGTILGLFGLGIYHGALRIFGSLMGGVAGLLLFFANRAALPELAGLGGILFPMLFAVIGGWIGSWLAAVAHFVLFFIIGCLTGWLALHVHLGHINLTATTGTDWDQIPTLIPFQWLLIAGFGLIYLAAANWMIAITAAILGATMVSTVLDNRLVLYIGAPLGILVQYALFLRREEYRGHRHPVRRYREEDERGTAPRVIYNRGEEWDED